MRNANQDKAEEREFILCLLLIAALGVAVACYWFTAIGTELVEESELAAGDQIKFEVVP